MDPGQLLSRSLHGSAWDPPAHTLEHPDGVFISLQAVPPRSHVLTARLTRLAPLVVPQPCGMPSSPSVPATLQEARAQCVGVARGYGGWRAGSRPPLRGRPRGRGH